MWLSSAPEAAPKHTREHRKVFAGEAGGAVPRKPAAGGHKRAPSATTQRFLPLDYRYRALQRKGRGKGETSEGRKGGKGMKEEGKGRQYIKDEEGESRGDLKADKIKKES